MFGESLKFAFADSHVAMNFAQRASAIGDGSSCRGRKELSLHPAELVHWSMVEVMFQFAIREDLLVEAIDQAFNRGCAPDSIIEGSVVLCHRSRFWAAFGSNLKIELGMIVVLVGGSDLSKSVSV